mmetsp:Transcript_138343/g.385888  ORF Transcript_138343/g.385888 Transcript_138343/m.385888 type:complete len:329 (+) Transcript_138343:474-1460(+)
MRKSVPVFGKFWCGKRPSQSTSEPLGAKTLTTCWWAGSHPGTWKGLPAPTDAVLIPSCANRSSGLLRPQSCHRLWYPGAQSSPPLVSVCAVRHTKAWTRAKPGSVQGFWSQCSQFSRVRHSLRTAVGRMTPHRGASCRRMSSAPWRPCSSFMTWTTSGACASSQHALSAWASKDSKKFLPPSCCGQSALLPHDCGSSRRIFEPLPRSLGLSHSSSTAASISPSLSTPVTTTRPSLSNCSTMPASSPKGTVWLIAGAMEPGTLFKKLYKASAWVRLDAPFRFSSKCRIKPFTLCCPVRHSVERTISDRCSISFTLSSSSWQETIPLSFI